LSTRYVTTQCRARRVRVVQQLERLAAHRHVEELALEVDRALGRHEGRRRQAEQVVLGERARRGVVGAHA
jgi:hypothetical protein